MIVYPDIEIQNGKCVNLVRGQMDKPVVYDQTPLEAAKWFDGDGADFLHIIDLDAVADPGSDANSELICEIIKAVNAPVQIAGGIRSVTAADWWFDHGAQRVVFSTSAVKNPSLVGEVATKYPGKVMVSVDARDGRVVVEGWRETTMFTPIEFARQFETLDLAGVIFTDIDRDDDLQESSLAATTEMATALILPVIASGPVKSLDDISTLRYLPNIAGAITGRALFTGAFTLAEAIEVARSQ